MPKVSVVIPVFGVENYIEQCAVSLFSQTLDDIEFIFVDDCSKDLSIKRLSTVIENNRDQIARMNWQVRIAQLPVNSGQAAARKHGIRLASGTYIVHCDSDDWVEPDTFRLMYEKAIADNADCVVCEYFITDGSSSRRIVESLGGETTSFIKRLLLRQDSWSLCNKMFRRSLYFADGFVFPIGNLGEDMVICLQLLLNADTVSFIGEPLYYYRVNASSITRVRDEKIVLNNKLQLFENSKIVLGVFELKGLTRIYQKELRWFKYYIKSSASRICINRQNIPIWRSIYPEINLCVLFMRLKLRDKLFFFLCLIGLTPLIRAFRKV